MNYLLQTVFEKDYQFVPVTNVFEAMFQMKIKKNIDLLIVDIDFQEQQSWEFINHIKTSKLYEMPVVVLTTQNNPGIEQKCYEAAIDEIFFKPFDPVEIIASVKNMITGREVLQA
jgi:CheY-like chemotaxis protein